MMIEQFVFLLLKSKTNLSMVKFSHVGAVRDDNSVAVAFVDLGKF